MTLSLHERIRTDLEGRILAGALAPGDRLPTELELMQIYGCSRMTVNKAVSALSAVGLVERRKRSGTIVARPRVHTMIIDVPDLPTEVAARGKSYRYEMLVRRIRRPQPHAMKEQALAGGGKLLEIEGLHYADGEPLAVEYRLVSLLAAPAIADADLTEMPAGSWLLLHIPWTEAETRVSAVGADRENASRLRVEIGTPCLLIERTTRRGPTEVTHVRQYFLGETFDLFARFSHEAAGLRTEVREQP